MACSKKTKIIMKDLGFELFHQVGKPVPLPTFGRIKLTTSSRS